MTKSKSSIRIISLRDFVSLPFKFFGAVGIRFFKWDESDKMTAKEKFVLAVSVVNMIINFLAITGYMIFDVFVDTVQLSQYILYLSFAMNGFFKVFSVLIGRKILNRILKDLQLLFPRNSRFRRELNIAKGFDYINRHAKIMCISHWIIALMFIIFPIVQSSVEFFKTNIFVARTPYIMTYPFDITLGMGFAFAYVSQFFGGLTISCYFVGSDMLLICTIYVVILQFKYLCYRIEHFESKNIELDWREIKDIMEKHNQLNDLAFGVNRVFSLSILLNYLISIIVIVLIAIQIVTGSELLDFVKFIGFFASATIQVYYVCFFGSQLIECSGLVGEKFIGQQWYMADIRYQRMLTLAIARSQKPAHLTAFKFFMISMDSFYNLMTTAYQFFTLLKTRMEEQNL